LCRSTAPTAIVYQWRKFSKFTRATASIFSSRGLKFGGGKEVKHFLNLIIAARQGQLAQIPARYKISLGAGLDSK